MRHLRQLFLAIGVGCVLYRGPVRFTATSVLIVISEFRTRGPNGGNDEFIELFNRSLVPVSIGGWQIKGSNGSGTVSTRANLNAGIILNPGCHYVLTNSNTTGGPYSGSAGDQTHGGNQKKKPGCFPFAFWSYTRLLTGFRLWRKAADLLIRQWIEQRIIIDAGILGHYVTDGANPHHTTVHHNEWAKGLPNPNGYATDNTFHSRFEAQFVGARVSLADLLPKIGVPRLLNNPGAEVLAYLRASNSQVERL